MDIVSRQPSPLCPILMTPIETAIKIPPDVSIYKPLGFWNPVKANNDTSRWRKQNTNHRDSSAFGRTVPHRLASSVVRHLFLLFGLGVLTNWNFCSLWCSNFWLNKEFFGRGDKKEQKYTKRTFYNTKNYVCNIINLRDIWY